MRPPGSRDRGEFRSFFTAISDDPAFVALPDAAVRLLVVLKLELPSVGIGIIRPRSLIDVLPPEWTAEKLEESYRALESPKSGSSTGWIQRAGNVVWIINGLHFERGLYPKNKKHRPFVQRMLNALGDSEITRRFQAYYSDWFDGDSKAYDKDIEGVSEHRKEEEIENQQETGRTPLPPARGVRDSIPEEFRGDYDELIARAPNATAWNAEISAVIDGMRTSGGGSKPPTWEQMGQAIRDYNANGAAPNLVLFRSYLRRATAEPKAETPRGGSVRSSKKQREEPAYTPTTKKPTWQKRTGT